MTKREQTSLKNAINELDGDSNEYFIIAFDKEGKSYSQICQGNFLKMAMVVGEASDEMKKKAVKVALKGLLEEMEEEETKESNHKLEKPINAALH